MRLGTGVRRSLLLVHILTSVGMMGAIASFFALAWWGLADAPSGPTVYPAMNAITQVLIVPLAFVSLLIGTIQALGTQWGLFRHYWVVVKLGLTLIVLVVLLLQTANIALLAGQSAATLALPEWANTRFSMVLHAGGGFVVLGLALVLSVYKPKGFTPYGWRRRREQDGGVAQT